MPLGISNKFQVPIPVQMWTVPNSKSHCRHEGINAKVHTQLTHTISMNHVLEGRGGSLRGSFLIGAQTELPMGSRVECSGELASNWAAEFSHLTQRGSVCGPTLRVFCQHQLWDIYSLLPHVPEQPLDTTPATLRIQSTRHINKTLWQI